MSLLQSSGSGHDRKWERLLIFVTVAVWVANAILIALAWLSLPP